MRYYEDLDLDLDDYAGSPCSVCTGTVGDDCECEHCTHCGENMNYDGSTDRGRDEADGDLCFACRFSPEWLGSLPTLPDQCRLYTLSERIDIATVSRLKRSGYRKVNVDGCGMAVWSLTQEPDCLPSCDDTRARQMLGVSERSFDPRGFLNCPFPMAGAASWKPR